MHLYRKDCCSITSRAGQYFTLLSRRSFEIVERTTLTPKPTPDLMARTWRSEDLLYSTVGDKVLQISDSQSFAAALLRCCKGLNLQCSEAACQLPRVLRRSHSDSWSFEVVTIEMSCPGLPDPKIDFQFHEGARRRSVFPTPTWPSLYYK